MVIVTNITNSCLFLNGSMGFWLFGANQVLPVWNASSHFLPSSQLQSMRENPIYFNLIN